MKQFKNLLCILLAVLMLCSGFCVSVWATDDSGEIINPDTSESTVADTSDSETTDSTTPDCDSKPVQQETTETTEDTSIPLTGPDGTAPTDPSETTDPTETTTASASSSETTAVESQETTIPTESVTETDPTETTVQTEPTEETEATEPAETEPTETTQPDTTPRLNKKKLELKAGETFNLKVKYSKGERVRYSSDNTKIAIVSSGGKVTALKKGVAKITVRMGSEKFICKVTVTTNPKLKKAGKTVTVLNLKAGQKTKVNLAGKAEAINNVYNNSPIAIFSALPTATKLKVKAIKPGTTTISVKVNNSKTVKLKVIVK